MTPIRRTVSSVALAAGATALLLGLLPPSAAAAAPGAAALPSSRVLALPHYRQQQSNDCEAAALRMALAYRGHRRSDRQLLASIGIDLKHPDYGRSGKTSGDPYRAFVGSPDGSELHGTGYGVFYPPVAAAAKANGGKVLAAQEHYSPAKLYLQLRAGHPAVVWVDYLWRAKASSHYRAYDGRSIPYAGPAEHAVTLAGVTPHGVYVADPARGYYWIAKTKFQAGYSTYRDMAVVLS
ncbi:C39 family peptidase [Streptacidiphilus cavernicola]|uniref:C39 family peptidase n=1 Tax=Streptacidiphilus cavernicola TaxID=3342716 RepID=A0ABV6VQN7_9ACTN